MNKKKITATILLIFSTITNATGSLEPPLKTPKALMLPVTVPKRPSIVAIFAIVPRAVRKCSYFGITPSISAERNLFASLVVDSVSGEILRLRKAAGGEHYFTYDKKHDGVKPLRIPYRHVEKAALDALENECRMARKMEKLGLVVRHEDGRVETIRTGEVSVRGLYGYVE